MNKIPKFGLLLASITLMALGPSANADPITVDDTDRLWEDGFYPEHPYVGEWQPANDLPGVQCQRSRTVISGACVDYTEDAFDYDYSNNLFYLTLGHVVCVFRDHGIANYQAGTYVPGVGCTDWKSTNYEFVTGYGGPEFGTLQD